MQTTKEHIVAEIKRCAQKLGRPPGYVEFHKESGIGHRQLRKHFGTWSRALQECQMVRCGSGFRAKLEDLFRDYASVVRQLGNVPGAAEYSMHSKYSVRPLLTRYGTWKKVAQAMRTYAAQVGIEDQYRDVMNILSRYQAETFKAEKTSFPRQSGPWRAQLRKDRPIYGVPLLPSALTYEPTSENAVIFLFGMLAEELGFFVKRIQVDFPDCEALVRVNDEQCQELKIEFELVSSNFVRHMHDPDGCDMIVCWRHDWPECPMDVLELSVEVKRLLEKWSKKK